MDFLETLKRDADKKYSQMLSGEAQSPIETIKIADSSKFIEKNEAYHKRMEEEHLQLERSLALIKKNKSDKINAENLQKQYTQTIAREKAERDAQIAREKAERDAQIAREKSVRKKRAAKIIIAVGVVLLVICAIITGVLVSKNKNEAKYGASHISATITEKSNGTQSYNYYTTNFKMVVKNDCKIDITYIVGDLVITAVDNGKELWKGDLRLTGSITANGGKSTWDLELKSTGSDLWNYPLEGMNIQLKITGATFADYTSKEYSDSYRTIYSGKSIGKTDYQEINYQSALRKFNAGDYEGARTIFETLGNYKQSEDYLVQCEDKIFQATMESDLKRVAGNNAILPDNYIVNSYNSDDYTSYNGQYYSCFWASFGVPNGEASIYLDKFRNKLINNGFTALSDYVYKKGSTIIQFSKVNTDYGLSSFAYEAFQI